QSVLRLRGGHGRSRGRRRGGSRSGTGRRPDGECEKDCEAAGLLHPVILSSRGEDRRSHLCLATTPESRYNPTGQSCDTFLNSAAGHPRDRLVAGRALADMSGPGRSTGSGQSGGTGLETCPRCGAVYALPMEQCHGCGLVLPERAARMGPGTILDGKYQIVSLLGSGGMGEVFKVRHIQLNAVRTIKVLRSNLLADEWYRNRFLREARLATQVHHSNVAVVHDFATLPNGSYYMVSEFIDGLTVRQWLKRYGAFPLGLAIEVVSQVLSGLGHCHRRGLLHRDISPDNIMISVDAEDHPVAKIIDLGIAKQVAGNAADATQTGLFMGNPRYCSPEQLGQLKEGEELDLRTDLYSMGMVLYEMVTGSGP